MRILFVNSLYLPDVGGGAELILSNLAAGLHARGHEVRIAATTRESGVVTGSVDGVPVTRLPLKNIYWHHGSKRRGVLQRSVWHALDSNNRSMRAQLDEVVEEFAPELISFHNLVGFSRSAWEVAKAAGIPAVQVLHDYYNLCPKSHAFSGGVNCGTPCGSCRVFRQGHAEQSNGLQGVIGVGRAVLDRHLEAGFFEDVPVQRIVNNAWSGRFVVRESYPATARTFGFIGTLGPWKGVRELLEAFTALVDELADDPPMLLVAGGGDDAYVRELRAAFPSPRIDFLGRTRAEAFYPRIDVGIVPSLWHDPLPGVTYEAMLHGAPVVAARRGGIPEIVRHGETGLIYDPEAPGALLDALRRFAVEPGTVEAFGRRAAVSCDRYADVDRFVDEHLAVYREVVERASKVPRRARLVGA